MSLRMAGVHHAALGAVPEHSADPEMLELWAERLAPQGVALLDERFLAGHGNSFTTTSHLMIEHFRAAGPPDLIIAAHATPDLDARMSLAGALAADDRLVFAVSDQGRLAPFSAFRLALGFLDRPRVLIIILDVGAVPYRHSGDGPIGSPDHAVGMLLDDQGPIRIGTPRQWADVPADQVSALVLAELDALAADLVIVGAGLHLPGRFPVRRAPEDQLCTAVWSVLAAELTDPEQHPRRIVVADYEPSLGYVGLMALDIDPRPTSTRTSTSTSPQPAAHH